MKVTSTLILTTLVALTISQSTVSSGNVIGYHPVYPDTMSYNLNGQTDYQKSYNYPQNSYNNPSNQGLD
jgi:hypothetical protein